MQNYSFLYKYSIQFLLRLFIRRITFDVIQLLKYINMNYLYSLTISLSAIMVIQSCSTTKVLNSNKKYTFPDDWYGTYMGTMNWYIGSEKRAEIPIKIEILESNDSNTIIWRTTYDSTKLFPAKNIKDYKIVRKDSLQKGHFLMDEQNGIYLDMRLIDNTLYSCFDVVNEAKNQTSRLISLERLLHKNVLYHEVISYSEPDKKTGNEGESKGFTVKSTEKISTQKATLRRTK